MTGELTIVTCANCEAKNRVDLAKARDRQPVCGRCGKPLSPPGAVIAEPFVVTDDTFEREVLGAGMVPVLVDFWAQWCGPCRLLSPVLEQIARESAGRFHIAKLNVDENPRTAQRYNISSIPAMMIFKHGKKIDELIGLAPKQKILAALTRAM